MLDIRQRTCEYIDVAERGQPNNFLHPLCKGRGNETRKLLEGQDPRALNSRGTAKVRGFPIRRELRLGHHFNTRLSGPIKTSTVQGGPTGKVH